MLSVEQWGGNFSYEMIIFTLESHWIYGSSYNI